MGPNLLLPWYSTEEEDQRFKQLLKKTALVFLVLFFIILFYPVPEKTREQKESLPPELARVILEKQALPPPAPVKPKAKPKLKPKPKTARSEPKLLEPKPLEPVKPPKPEVTLPPAKVVSKPIALKPKAVPVKKAKPSEAAQEQQRKRAQQQAASELAQFQDALADMRDLNIDTKVNNTLTRGAAQAKKTDRKVIASQAKASSGGINTAKLSRDTGGQALAGRKSTQVNSQLANQARAADAKRKRAQGADGSQMVSRSEESVRKVMDKNKAAIDIIYQKALRKSPALEGHFEVKLVIEPGGNIASVTIISSELGDKALEKRLLTRIGFINFGRESVARTTLNFTFNFFPR